MEWNPDYLYRIRGTWAVRGSDQIIVFNLTNAVPTAFLESEQDVAKRRRMDLCPEEWSDLIIRPCEPDAPDSLRWPTGGGEKELKNRDLLCKIFAAKLFDLMSWKGEYRYTILGKPVTCDGEVLFLFQLTDFELFARAPEPAISEESLLPTIDGWT